MGPFARHSVENLRGDWQHSANPKSEEPYRFASFAAPNSTSLKTNLSYLAVQT